MNTLAVIALLTLSIVYPTGPATVTAQDATPSPTGSIAMVTLEELPPEPLMLLSIVRTTLPAGETLQVASGSGPAVLFMEDGPVSIEIGEGAPQPRISRHDDSATPASTIAGEPGIDAGDTVVLPPGTTSTLANESDSPVNVLTLIAAPDAAMESSGEGEPSLLVSRELTFPEPPVVVTLDRVELLPGARLTLPEEPEQFVFATVERGDAYLLSAQGFNRGEDPLEAYILTISPT